MFLSFFHLSVPVLIIFLKGGKPGYLLYSFQGSKIPDYTYLPEKVREDIENRVPHYKHAPQSKCFPDMNGSGHSLTGGVTSWSFFKENFEVFIFIILLSILYYIIIIFYIVLYIRCINLSSRNTLLVSNSHLLPEDSTDAELTLLSLQCKPK